MEGPEKKRGKPKTPKSTTKKKSLSEREKRRLEWWSVRSNEGENTAKRPAAPEEKKTDQPPSKKAKLDVTSEEAGKVKNASDGGKKTKKEKAFIVFVGNLPFEATAEDVKNHFMEAGNIKDVRLLTKKDTGESRGCAYVEFANRTSHMIGLKMHESLMGTRKINVEFTSRGRKTPLRMKRLEEKNKRGQRFRCNNWRNPNKKDSN